MSITCQKKYSITVGGVPAPDLYWKFDEAASPWKDAIAGVAALSTVTGVATGGVSGIIGNGVKLSSSVSAFGANIRTPNVAKAYPADKGFSFSVWLKFVPPETNTVIACSWAIFNAGNDWQLTVNVFDVSPNHVLFSVEIDDDSGGIYTHQIDLGTPSTGVWHFYAFTFNQATNLSSFYVDSTLVGTDTSTITLVALDSVFGSLESHAIDFTFRDLTVWDEIGVWVNTVLTAAHVTALWNGGAGSRPLGV